MGSIPIISDIVEGIRWIIDMFIKNSPPQVKIGVFLLFLLIGANLISISFHLFGIHCDSDKQVVKTDFIHVTDNFRVMYITTLDALTGSNKTLESTNNLISIIQDPDDTCYFMLKQVGDDYEICDNLTSGDCNFYYREQTCANCSSTVDVGWIYSQSSLLNYIYVGDICNSDAYYNPDVSTFYRLISCEPVCDIPKGYKFNFDTGKLDCIDLDICGENGSLVISELDRLLEKMDAELYYVPNEDSIDNFIGFKCSNDYNPRLALFRKLDIFDFKIWVLLIVVSVMLLSLHHIRDWTR